MKQRSASIIVSAGVLISALSVPAEAAEQVGVSAAVRGNVELIQPGETRQASSGAPVHFQEKILSATDSGMQLMLFDKTTLTVGPESEIVIDEMVYDPSGGNSSLAVTVAKGAFRYLSGEIAKQNPERVSIKTPMGVIGVRGTNLFATQTNGQWFFGLLGPGPGNNTGDKPGGFVFKNPQGDTAVRRPGYGFLVAPGEAPGTVGPIPPEIFAQFSSSMTKSAGKKANGDANGDGGQKGDGDGDGKGGSSLAASEKQSGQKQAVTRIAAISVKTTQTVQKELTKISSTSTQSNISNTVIIPAGTYIPLTYSEVRSYSGSATYSSSSNPIVLGSSPNFSTLTPAAISNAASKLQSLYNANGAIGSYAFDATANFTARTISGSFYDITASHADIQNLSGASLSFTHSWANENGTHIAAFDPYAYSVPGSGQNLDAGVAFIKSTANKPKIGHVLMITDSNWNDKAFGAGIISAH